MRKLNLDEYFDYDYETNQQEIINYLLAAWNSNYNPTVSKTLYDFRVDSISVVEFFEVLIRLRNACQLSYRVEYNCVRIIEYDSSLPNMNSSQMMEDLFKFYEELELMVIEDK